MIPPLNYFTAVFGRIFVLSGACVIKRITDVINDHTTVKTCFRLIKLDITVLRRNDRKLKK